jgi:type IV pilus assembly protein PilA
MVVILIIGILVSIAVPVYRNVSGSSKEKADLANINSIERAIQVYMADVVTSGTYAQLTMSNTGVIGGVTVKPGAPPSLVPEYLKEMPKQPGNNTGSYVKVPNGQVVKE